MVYDSLVAIDVDVDGFMAFIEEKGMALEDMGIRHEDEFETWYQDSGIELAEQFEDDAQKI